MAAMRIDEMKSDTLIVKRAVKNTDDIVAWATKQGLATMLDPKQLHVTICYSKTPFEWAEIEKLSEDVVVPEAKTDKEKEKRKIEMFGKDKNVLVLQFYSDDLAERHQFFLDSGASSDFPDYKSHVTITYNGEAITVDHKDIEPYYGEIIFSKEIFKPIDPDWDGTNKEIDLTESFHKGFHQYGKAVEVFKNPSRAEFQECTAHQSNRAFLVGDDMYVWHVYSAVHQQVREALGLGEDAIPVLIYGDLPSKSAIVLVTDNSRHTKWHHNEAVNEEIMTCGHLKKLFSDIEINYYDEDIVGPWGALAETLMESRDHPEDIPEAWWFNPERQKFLKCDEDEDHAEYAERHHRKMKLPVSDVAEIINDGDAISEFEELAMDNGWVKGEGSKITAKGVDLLQQTMSYFIKRWPGEKMTLVLANRWTQVIKAIDLETLDNDLIIDLSEDYETEAPKKFWLVFDMPTATWNEGDLQKHESIFRGLQSGKMNGVRGISDTREIIGQFFAVARNAALVMDGKAVMSSNSIEKIAYDDPEELLRDNMELLYRLLNKERDRFGHRGLMERLAGYVTQAMEMIDYPHGHLMSYYGFESRIGDFWFAQTEIDKTINSIEDLQDFFFRAIKRASQDDSVWRRHLKDAFEDLDKEIVNRAVLKCMAHIGRIYMSEGEWQVRDPVFTVPKKSVLLILMNKKILDTYGEWKQGNYNLLKGRDAAYREAEMIFNVIEEYGLRDRYDVRFIDAQKFDKIRGDLVVKRMKRRVDAS